MRFKKHLLTILVISLIAILSSAKADLENYTTLRDIDKWTFNEYRYLMVREYFKMKEQYELTWKIDKTLALNLLNYAKTGYNYLPDSLLNQNIYNNLSIAIKKWYEESNSEVHYEEIVKNLNDYLEKVNIQSLKWFIEVTPSSWNAPLTATFRARVTDPSWTIIPASNYIWWVDSSWVKKVIWKWLSINYTFKEEWNFSVFLDVKSSHKNKAWYTDVLPFSSRGIVEVKEKIASVIIKINSTSLRESDEIKFTPDEANYGLIFDATSSTPTGWAKFRRTEWNFWNWVERKYDGDPKIERVVYSKEWNFTVTLKLITNEWKFIERKFIIAIHKPIATIQTNAEEWFIWNKFTFTAKASVNEKNLSYSWNIIDINNDKIIATKEWSVISQVFSEKWRYNIQLKVKDAAWNEDIDTKIIHVNSRAPIAEFNYSIPDKAKPNRVLLDGTKSHDPDFSDDGKLRYVWTINGEIVELENPDSKWAIWYYTFDSIWDQSIILEVFDTDEVSGVKQQKVRISSVLSVEFFPFPRVVQRNGFVRFVATSPNARYFEWDFGDGTKKSLNTNKVEHIYEKSGTFNVKLLVRDTSWNTTETSKTVYVWESNTPYAIIWIDIWANQEPIFDSSACSKWAYIVDRTKTVNFKWWESINIDGNTTDLSYSWKIWNDKFVSSKDTSFKFNELGCFPIKLTVKSNKNWNLSTTETFVKVENLKPTFTTLDISIQNTETDPIIVNVSALWAKDPDWVIQSYLWYYYTDTDLEPQDFRITSLANTTFVIPKITWNYYFVVVMRDNNDERYSSDESTSNKYFISLSGDNINTPLIDFKVNKNSVLIWEEAVFTTTVKNVLWQDITEKSEFAWDFDWDGFYDKETNVWNITYVFKNSWTFYSKVRVKYKWMTNVRTIEMNVANILEPEFNYISIWDTYLFFNTSSWKFDYSTWNLWDGTIIENKNYFSHTFTDKKTVHEVSLKITEWTKSKSKTKEVVKNLKNMLIAKNADSLTLFSFPEIKDDKILLLNQNDKVIVNIWTLSWVVNYGVDFDINIDNDLNGGKDDDIDNKNDTSFEKAGLLEIVLNENKKQTFRIFLLDSQSKIIESKDITIEKEYIKDEEIDINTLTFSWVSVSEKAKIEKLKSFVSSLPQEHRLKAMQYVQKLQEEWFHINEKTKIILEFEWYIDSLSLPNWIEIINLLESFLIEWQEDQSVRNMAYNVVKNLIPKELIEYEDIIYNLDLIKSNPDKIEENKVLWKEILEIIKNTPLITKEDKITIKTQLQVFIYGSVDNIPEEIKQNVESDSWESNKIIWLLSSVIKFIGILFAWLIFVIIWFYVWFKISNKNKNLWLQDFIIEKTSSKSNDILWELANTKPVEEIEKKKVEENIIRQEKPKEEIIETKLEEQSKEETTTSVTEEIKKERKDNVPDWLKWALSTDTKSQEVVKEENIKNEDVLQEELKKEEIIQPQIEAEVPELIETKFEEEKIPDWLKWALSTDKLKSEEIQDKTIEIVQEENVKKSSEEKKPKTKKKVEEKEEEKSTKPKKKTEDFWTLDEAIKDEDNKKE